MTPAAEADDACVCGKRSAFIHGWGKRRPHPAKRARSLGGPPHPAYNPVHPAIHARCGQAVADAASPTPEGGVLTSAPGALTCAPFPGAVVASIHVAVLATYTAASTRCSYTAATGALEQRNVVDPHVLCCAQFRRRFRLESRAGRWPGHPPGCRRPASPPARGPPPRRRAVGPGPHPSRRSSAPATSCCSGWRGWK